MSELVKSMAKSYYFESWEENGLNASMHLYRELFQTEPLEKRLTCYENVFWYYTASCSISK